LLKMRVLEVELSGRRVLRTAAYTMDEVPRFLIWSCYADDAELPVGAHCVSFPADVWPALREAIDGLEAEA
jgi:hypothetical protein